jgi:cysteine desulfurase
LGINGLLTSESVLFYSGTDRAPVHAIADDRSRKGLAIRIDSDSAGTAADIRVYQPFNPETGIHTSKPEDFAGQVFVDNTAFGVHAHLPHNWAAAMWQSRSWHGPAGLGVLAIRNTTTWRNPLPHNDINKVPQSFSIPLAIASAVALENFTKDYEAHHQSTEHFKKVICDFLVHEIGDVVIAGADKPSSPFLISASIAGVDAERLLHLMNERGIAIDTGSACLTSNMQPSHVLAAMGLPTEGNIRLTLHPQRTSEEIEFLLKNLKEVVISLR